MSHARSGGRTAVGARKREEHGEQAFTRGLGSGAGFLWDRRQTVGGGRRAVGGVWAAERAMTVRASRSVGQSNARARAQRGS